MQKSLALLLVLTLLNGCIFRDRSEDYRRAGSIAPINLPEGVRSVPLEPLYPIPEVQVREQAFHDLGSDGFVIPRPDALSPEREQSKIRIQRVAGQRWVLAEASPSQVWPLAQSFLSRYGIDVQRSVPAVGLVETDWVVFRDDETSRSQFQIRIEKGVREDSTEIHVLQRQAAADGSVVGTWPTSSDNPAREAWLLDELANALAGDIGNRAASLLGQSVGGDIKAELVMEGPEPALHLRLSRVRAWASLAHALGREGLIVWGEDSAQGLFHVQYIDENRRRGRVARFFLGERQELTETAPHSLRELLGHLSPQADARTLFEAIPGAAFGEPLPDALGYLVVLQRRDATTDADYIVRVRDARGQRLDLTQNKRLLAVIRRNLI